MWGILGNPLKKANSVSMLNCLTPGWSLCKAVFVQRGGSYIFCFEQICNRFLQVCKRFVSAP